MRMTGAILNIQDNLKALKAFSKFLELHLSGFRALLHTTRTKKRMHPLLRRTRYKNYTWPENHSSWPQQILAILCGPLTYSPLPA